MTISSSARLARRRAKRSATYIAVDYKVARARDERRGAPLCPCLTEAATRCRQVRAGPHHRAEEQGRRVGEGGSFFPFAYPPPTVAGLGEGVAARAILVPR